MLCPPQSFRFHISHLPTLSNLEEAAYAYERHVFAHSSQVTGDSQFTIHNTQHNTQHTTATVTKNKNKNINTASRWVLFLNSLAKCGLALNPQERSFVLEQTASVLEPALHTSWSGKGT